MATIVQENGKFRAIIRRKGHRTVSKSGFESERAARDYATLIEAELLHGIELPAKVPAAPALSLGDALADYVMIITIKKKGAKREESRVAKLRQHSLAKKLLRDIKPADVTAYITERRAAVADATVRLEVMLISALFTYRIKEKHDALTNPVAGVRLPAGSKARSRVLRDGEFEYLSLGIAAAMPRTECAVDAVDLLVQTGMRQGELFAIAPNDVDLSSRYVRLDDTKSGDPRDVPLSPRAIAIFRRLIDGAEDKSARLFDVSQDAFGRAFPRACALGRELFEKQKNLAPSPRFLRDLKPHDLRHEAATRWSKCLQAQELAAMFGWRTLNLVLRYYAADSATIADKLAAA